MLNPEEKSIVISSNGPPDQALARTAVTPPAEALQHSATLMGSETPGAHGQVRTWAPDLKLLWRQTATKTWSAVGVTLTMVAIAVAWVKFMSHNPIYPVSWFTGLFATWGIALRHRRALGRPCYITADDLGLGVISEKGTATARWEEIVGIERVDRSGKYQLTAGGGKHISLNTYGHDKAALDDFTSVLCERAQLVNMNSFEPVRRTSPSLTSGSVVTTIYNGAENLSGGSSNQ